ncbi:capsular biosynthesis protein [Marinobacter salsuginis]|uniref:capsular biosynthesis protein n=1 Tax=Marinobacter salsuginis TaxID=418719 RepID=UPI001C94BF80|nr:capsular biosynthesis protein [Marinobacter salsuginis]MBY6070782.1 capsular biosynthesis protein [Marinobacter salsuginis]
MQFDIDSHVYTPVPVRMKVLVLSNGAPNYHNFFNAIARKLISEGVEVGYAVDCPASVAENKIKELGVSYTVFSNYFADHDLDENLLEAYSHHNLNLALFSDFDRSEEYGIWGARSNDFFDRLKSALLSFFEKLVDEGGYTAVLYENVSNAFAHFCWIVCQERGVDYIGFTASRLPGRFGFSSDPYAEHRAIDSTIQKLDKGELDVPEAVWDWSSEYIRNIENTTPDYMAFNKLDNVSIVNRYFRLSKLEKVSRLIRFAGGNHYYSFQRGNPVLYSAGMFLRSLRRRLRLPFIKKYYSAPKQEKFFLYPLHFHPESSTSILAASHVNEYETIKSVAFNLPEGYRLYVKDHISAWGYPDLGFYKKLAALPNVSVLSPLEPTKKLIKQSHGVVTLTSTVGYEALLLKKAVLLFGDVFYQSHPLVTRVGRMSGLFECFRGMLETPSMSDREVNDYNLKFVVAYHQNTVPGRLNLMLAPSEASSLVDEIFPLLWARLVRGQ